MATQCELMEQSQKLDNLVKKLGEKLDRECINVKFVNYKNYGNTTMFTFRVLNIETWEQRDCNVNIENIQEDLNNHTEYLLGTIGRHIRSQLIANFNQVFQGRSEVNQNRKYGIKEN